MTISVFLYTHFEAALPAKYKRTKSNPPLQILHANSFTKPWQGRHQEHFAVHSDLQGHQTNSEGCPQKSIHPQTFTVFDLQQTPPL